jgi:hypothetical protein
MEDLFAKYIEEEAPAAASCSLTPQCASDLNLGHQHWLSKEEVTSMPGDSQPVDDRLIQLFVETENRKHLAGSVLRSQLESFNGKKISSTLKTNVINQISSTCSPQNTRDWATRWLRSKDGVAVEACLTSQPHMFASALDTMNTVFVRQAASLGKLLLNASAGQHYRKQASANRTYVRRVQSQVNYPDDGFGSGVELLSKHRGVIGDVRTVDEWQRKWIAEI